MKKKMQYELIICGLAICLAGCGSSTKLVVDTEVSSDTESSDADDKKNTSESIDKALSDDNTAAVTEQSLDVSDDTFTDNNSTDTDTSITNETDITNNSSLYTTVTPDSNGNIIIDKDSISSTASYYNYQSGNTIIQLIGIATDSGEKRLAFNTCQSCNPSPQAYYQQQGDLLICQNCGFDFVSEDVGAVAGGCNPMPLEQLTDEDGQFIIPASYLDTFVDVYANWTGPVS